ncbi:dTDP-4-dehydrorhamnose 3,5-epimerase family protein [Thalassospira sp. A3_1]|uniref:dTDP-4-dehydrorhamnose 3,5-epimerase family protein n=1 Tax=Thalassospira sp. A3_1 TaxID=2821088 RepID=UPI001ADB292B|nr:dTDP-4-dehydrorhamnose 3,5-epimerase family protein [Thalassospira sp. A3_1]MBO9506230.1 dTDP-4-dehydrorhamnose 3,5-epimerase family protein [Thalassospira sp. A3_1]
MQSAERFSFEALHLEGTFRITRKKLGDERGFLERMFCGRELAEHVGFGAIAQINRTMTRAVGVVRGMHYQNIPSVEAKIVTCLRGAILDVIVDIREGSPTFLQHVAVSLSSDDDSALYVPHGFAHGFQTLKPDTELLYLHDNYYDPEHERGLQPLDPALAIAWPLEISQMSERDRNHPAIKNDFEGIVP